MAMTRPNVSQVAQAAAAGANSSITSMNALASVNGGQLAGLRNRIINGGMMIDQRNLGVAQTITAGAALAYTVDRWYAYCTGANVTGQQVVSNNAPSYYNYVFTGAASVSKIGFAQRIEMANAQDLPGQTVTISADLANSLLSTVTYTVWRANSGESFGTLASPTRTQLYTGTFTVNNILTRYSAQIALGGSAIRGIEIEFSVGAQTSGTWIIGRVQLELGSVATTFEQRPYGLELALCQRYFHAIGGVSGSPWAISQLSGIGGSNAMVVHPITMRASPALAIVGTGFNAQDNSAGPATATISLSTSSPVYSAITYTHAALTANAARSLAFSNATSYLQFSAEL